MNDEEGRSEKAIELRMQAEEIIRENTPLSPEGLEYLSPQIMRYALHDLHVHQIELRVQNEELRRVQVELEASQVRYFDLYNQAPVGYCTLDARGLILEANATAEGLLGVPRGLLAQQPITRFIHKDDQDIYYLYRKQLLKSFERQAAELRMVASDDVAFWARLDATTLRGGEDPPTLRLVIVDITERKQAEDQQRLLQIQHQQGQKMESLGSLAGGVAHDMNNVLGAILVLASGNLDIQPVGSPAHRAFDTISKAALRGAKMVKGLLSFARQTPVEESDLDLNVILQEVVHLLERTTLSKVSLKMELARDLRPIRGDAGALTHAFMNLCVNAVDAMPEPGTLTLRTRNVNEDWVEVEVQDTGTGMNKEILEKALDPFFTTKEIGKGTGLGLSIVYSLVKAHHGELELLSEPGQGTRVKMRFPGSDAIPAAEPPVERGSEPAPVPLNILVVDDDELIQTSLQMILETLGHTITPAMCGEEALAKLESGFEPDVVILDMNMPGLGGAGTLPRLRALRPETPVMITTGRVDQTTLRLLAVHDGVTLLPKPFNKSDLQRHLGAIQPG